MKKKKVLILVEAFDKGGIEKVTLDIVNNLDLEKYDITVQTFWYGGHCQSQVRDGVQVKPFFFKRYVPGVIRLIAYLSPKWLYRLFVHGKYDVEIAASDGGAAKVISGSSNKNARKICWVHMDVVERGSKLKEFRTRESGRKIYEKYNTIACVSNQCLSKFQQKFGLFPDMRTVHNPLPEKDIIDKSTLFSVGHTAKVEFSTVGRLAVEKGFDRLINASVQLDAEGYDFRVHIVGDGVKKDELTTLIAKKNIGHRVILEGYASNPYPYIRCADWYICSSLDEAYPLSVGEALLLGKPVMGTDCSGIREWLGDNQYGLVLENSTDGIYAGMKAAMNMDSNEYQKWITKGHEKTLTLNFHSSITHWQNIVLGDAAD